MPFNLTSDRDRQFFEGVVNESIKIFGFNIKYYVTQFNNLKNPIFSEDTRPKITGEYKMKAYSETIQEDWILSRFGLGSDDLLKISIDVKEFSESVGDFKPKPGDYVFIDYMGKVSGRLFIVTTLDMEDNIFLQKKFVYNIQLKAADISGEEISSEVLRLAGVETLQDTQNDNITIDSKIADIKVEKSGDKNIFGDYE